ncbi:hypothetical protein Bca4012_009705 [Brassica carinata]|uniref:Uncharacterized protein n=1 Tax=Brassica carinata TaxID=52824 RepID=A0A8X7V033_BRACI|nr:hypothetical protein Bca52824_034957 [Brassica carinata]
MGLKTMAQQHSNRECTAHHLQQERNRTKQSNGSCHSTERSTTFNRFDTLSRIVNDDS